MAENNKSKAEQDSEVVIYEPVEMTKGEMIGLGAAAAAVIAFLGGVSWLGWKEDKANAARLQEEAEAREARARERDEWITEQQSTGHIVMRLDSGKYVSLTADDYTKLKFKKF